MKSISMTHTLKYISSLILVITLVSCQSDDSADQTAQQQASQQQQSQQMPGQMGQQQAAPDVDLSEEEAETFADAIIAAQKVQAGAQQELVSIIEDEGLDIQTYQKIAQASQQGQEPADSVIEDGDMDKFDSANESIKEAQQGIQSDVADAVEEAGMEMERFQEINRAVQQDPELQKQIRQKLQEKMGGMQQQPQQQPSNQ
ncbi:DUF4168 domain-containing protein [Aliifodinibius salicampi]|uniref:DUF4168 domain-containing protein n=1 Tax=Fodinibius salicampi TaxID=1920655 RepID=A0ABT3PX81_9BACT|nr:DUF4168 domain-containing protein [Fodinibius salicampi]MCW9712396.1 DUF4168 domain-containing protein [Fodinibius salicampi]